MNGMNCAVYARLHLHLYNFMCTYMCTSLFMSIQHGVHVYPSTTGTFNNYLLI